MRTAPHLPDEKAIASGKAFFRPDMPVWEGLFGDDVWPFFKPTDPRYVGPSSSAIVWSDYVHGKGSTFGHPNSFRKSSFSLCLTLEIVRDLKIAAVIHGFFPKLVKHAVRKIERLDPQTVKGRIDELAKFISRLIVSARKRKNIYINSLSDISFSLVREEIASYPGRAEHLKRALKLISEPNVQQNLSKPLQWGLPDIEKSQIAWKESRETQPLPTLSDEQFLSLMDYCKQALGQFKAATDIPAHDHDCQFVVRRSDWSRDELSALAVDSYYEEDLRDSGAFHNRYGHSKTEIWRVIRDGHIAALLVVLLLTAMRISETRYLKRDCLVFQHGYWFLISKEAKRRPKDAPIAEGWLAIDLTRDAYDVLMFITAKTGKTNLFSSPFLHYIDGDIGYRGNSLNTKFSRWLRLVDVDGVFEHWKFSTHQCRETLVAQLANEEVGLPFISMQLKHFHSQFNSMPNAVTAGYGQYRKQLITSVTKRLAIAREEALLDVYGEDAKFAGGGGAEHKARIDAFFTGQGLFGEQRVQYIKEMAQRGVKLMPTSIGHCGRSLTAASSAPPPPCYGDYQCDPECKSHIVTARSADILILRAEFAHTEAILETNPDYKVIWLGIAERIERHVAPFRGGRIDD
jgi:integrase